MRNKKILFIAFVLLTCFLVIPNSSAVTCKYKDSVNKLTISFDLQMDRDGTIGSNTSTITGLDDGKNSEGVLNWDESFKKTSFTGKDYYEKNKKCPPYAILVKDVQYHLYVADDSNKVSIVEAIKKEYSKKATATALYLVGSNENGGDSKEQVEETHTCLDFNDKNTCETDDKVACVWVESNGYSYCNVDNLQYVKCGDTEDIPSEAPRIISFVINFFKIAAPILLVLVGAVTLAKAIASSSEDEMEKAKKKLIKKFIYAALVFFVIAIVQFVILKAADDSEEGSINSCLSCFLNNSCGESIYYKTTIGGIDIRTYLNGSTEEKTSTFSGGNGGHYSED